MRHKYNYFGNKIWEAVMQWNGISNLNQYTVAIPLPSIPSASLWRRDRKLAPVRLSCLCVSLLPLWKIPEKCSDWEALGIKPTHIQGLAYPWCFPPWYTRYKGIGLLPQNRLLSFKRQIRPGNNQARWNSMATESISATREGPPQLMRNTLFLLRAHFSVLRYIRI